ncbi:MAG: hypothetical protein ABI895_05455 [Deltaproteobacteria bacterium]
MSDESTGTEQELDPPNPRTRGKRRMSNLAVFSLIAKIELTRMMQASLVKSVAHAVFAEDPGAFRGHPANSSLTWHSLEATEGNCVVSLVEFFKNELNEPHVPAGVREKVEALVGHRHVVSHPSTLKAEEWTTKRMQKFETEGRRHESRVPLIWDLQHALNKELANEGSALIPDFYVTTEMIRLLRTLLEACMTPDNVAKIPDETGLATLVQGCRDTTLQRCQDRANGVPPPPKRETKLARMWAALERGEDPDSVE